MHMTGLSCGHVLFVPSPYLQYFLNVMQNFGNFIDRWACLPFHMTASVVFLLELDLLQGRMQNAKCKCSFVFFYLFFFSDHILAQSLSNVLQK